MIWLIVILGGFGCLAIVCFIIFWKAANECFGDKKEITIYEASESSKAAREEREESARKFWEVLARTEEILGRKLTENEVWRAMQQEKWHCACCGEKLEKIDNKLVECPLCGLKFQKDNAKNKIKCIGNMGDIL